MNEAALIARVRAGDEAAYRTLLDRHLGPVTAYVRRMMMSAPEADDIVQETFIRLWTQAQRYDPAAAKLSTWLHNIAHHLVIDHFRKHGRVVTGVADDDVVAEDISLSDQIVHREQHDQMSRCLMALPERQRSAIVMCHYQGMSNRDAAVILDVSVEALESLMARGRRKLRQLLAEQS
ncbi:MAG: sigma-70 family RNA polymerase sigma factor [Proteobacteria bacterium]|nr:sigma-70 family RNA polymerase sigma factor [Pseudomonadota bacterium]MDA1301867.1 sigma-70 family RNA polymerase sigma factor [Pseudomonadota bacterium]